MIKYMLDTDICSYIMKERPLHVLEHFNTLQMSQFCISIITYAEFKYGIEKSPLPTQERRKKVVNQFVSHVDILKWDQAAADLYSQIRVNLEAQGKTIGNMDMMIAAHALSRGFTLVTNNEKHFQRVFGLNIENWAKKGK